MELEALPEKAMTVARAERKAEREREEGVKRKEFVEARKRNHVGRAIHEGRAEELLTRLEEELEAAVKAKKAERIRLANQYWTQLKRSPAYRKKSAWDYAVKKAGREVWGEKESRRSILPEGLTLNEWLKLKSYVGNKITEGHSDPRRGDVPKGASGKALPEAPEEGEKGWLNSVRERVGSVFGRGKAKEVKVHEKLRIEDGVQRPGKSMEMANRGAMGRIKQLLGR